MTDSGSNKSKEPIAAGTSPQPEVASKPKSLSHASQPADPPTTPASLAEKILKSASSGKEPSAIERQLFDLFVAWDGNGEWDGGELTVSLRSGIETVAAEGYVKIQFRLAKLLLSNEQTSDDPQAAALLQQAADQGHQPSIHSLAWCLLDGEGVTADSVRGMKLLQDNAQRGFARSKNSLGYLLLQGTHVEVDQVEAVRWFRASAEQGNASAINNLGHWLGHRCRD